MGMRITNGIMNNNSKINIMTNKGYADRMNTQVATGQKITRPSDDPVIAIRNLRLNSNIDELTQYKTKNIPDADAWLKTTGTALDQTNAVLDDIKSNLTTGASDDNTAEDRMKIVENLSKLRDQIYASGNADYAGRTVFTGYRTGESLTYMESSSDVRYNIIEDFNAGAVENIKYVSGDFDVDRETIEKATDPADTSVKPEDYAEQTISYNNVKRVRLSYDELDYPDQLDTATKAGSTIVPLTLSYKEKDGTTGSFSIPVSDIVTTKGQDQSTIDGYYTNIGANEVRLIADTGELILGENVAKTLQADGTCFSITYAKTNFEKGDLRPEHYFACTSYDTTSVTATKEIRYNFVNDDKTKPKTALQNSNLGKEDLRQKLTYEVAFNQSIEINTNACDVYKHAIGRDVDELVKATQAVLDIEDKKAKIEALKEDEEFYKSNKETIDNMLDAATKEFDFLKETMQDLFSQALTRFEGYADDVNLANAKVGSMGQRLELTKERVNEQLENFKELSDENINIDLSESAIDLKSAQLALEAAQAATGKIAQQSLLNYI